jgi:hypothetical protein
MMKAGHEVCAQTSSSARAWASRPSLRFSWARSYDPAQLSPSPEAARAAAGASNSPSASARATPGAPVSQPAAPGRARPLTADIGA